MSKLTAKLEPPKAPTMVQTLRQTHLLRDFTMYLDGKVIGVGTVMQIINPEVIEADVMMMKDEERRTLNFSWSATCWDVRTETGFVWGAIPVRD